MRQNVCVGLHDERNLSLRGRRRAERGVIDKHKISESFLPHCGLVILKVGLTKMSSREVSQVPSKESVIQYMREVFGDPRKVYSWLNTPNRTFGGMRPKDFIECSPPEDLQQVMDELARIDQGIY